MSIEQKDFYKSVIGKALCDVEHLLDEMLVVHIDGAGKIHHMPSIAIRNTGKHKRLLWSPFTCPQRNAGGEQLVNIQRQMRPVLRHTARCIFV